MTQPTALIIGAGPAGLTAAYELATRTDIKPVVLEASSMVGGLARTENHNGNRIDIGGHRFFSKSEEVMRWWLDVLPLQRVTAETDIEVRYHKRSAHVHGSVDGPDPEATDRVMLVRPRRSRILHGRRFYDYPLSLSRATLGKLGIARAARIIISYLRSVARPIRDERTLEDFFINRFGRELYHTFFKSYTEKVWGVACDRIGAAWGAQRIKGLSVSRAIRHAVARALRPDGSLAQQGTETSLIERFLYPKLGPGQLWEIVAERVIGLGGEIVLNRQVAGVNWDGSRVTGLDMVDTTSGRAFSLRADHVFSTMPVRDLILAMDTRRPVPDEVRRVAGGLSYRDFISVGVLLNRDHAASEAARDLANDTWIYVQEPHVQVGRIQVFNNWSPYLVRDPSTVWLGLEYFCNEGDGLWQLEDRAIGALAVGELEMLGLATAGDVLDTAVVRAPKAYPGYFGTYDDFDVVRAFTDGMANLHLIGRNGMHRYNNQDHSMLTAMRAVDNILAGRVDKSNLWSVNAEQEYHEVARR